jgi:hypothetical protein
LKEPVVAKVVCNSNVLTPWQQGAIYEVGDAADQITADEAAALVDAGWFVRYAEGVVVVDESDETPSGTETAPVNETPSGTETAPVDEDAPVEVTAAPRKK